MSAFMCSDAHIDLLAYFATSRDTCGNRPYGKSPTARMEARVAFGEENPDLTGQPETVGGILYRANALSVETRYPDCHESNDMGTKDPYTYRPVVPTLATPQKVLQACRCFDYQACEADGWDTSLAYAIIKHIEGKAIAALVEGQPWTIGEAHVRKVGSA